MPDNDPTRTHAPKDHDATHTGTPELNSDVTLVKPQHQSPLLASNPHTPEILGFVIENKLGHGGMGIVYKAIQTGLNRVVALKMLIAGPFADPSLRARFLLEAESVAASVSRAAAALRNAATFSLAFSSSLSAANAGVAKPTSTPTRRKRMANSWE